MESNLKRKMYGVRINVDDLELLKEIAIKNEVTISHVIRKAVKEFINKMNGKQVTL